MSVDGHAVRRSVEGMVTKFHVHGLLDRAQELENLVQKFLTSFDFKDHGTVSVCCLSDENFEVFSMHLVWYKCVIDSLFYTTRLIFNGVCCHFFFILVKILQIYLVTEKMTQTLQLP